MRNWCHRRSSALSQELKLPSVRAGTSVQFYRLVRQDSEESGLLTWVQVLSLSVTERSYKTVVLKLFKKFKPSRNVYFKTCKFLPLSSIFLHSHSQSGPSEKTSSEMNIYLLQVRLKRRLQYKNLRKEAFNSVHLICYIYPNFEKDIK